MAEEAVGLAKSLGWSVEYGPKAAQVTSKQSSDSEDDAPGRCFTSSHRPSHTIDGEELHYGDRVSIPGTGLVGWFRPGGMEIDLDATSDEEDSGDEWQNPAIRENIAMTSIVHMRDTRPGTFFGAGKVRELGEFITAALPSMVFVNYALTSLQQRKLEK